MFESTLVLRNLLHPLKSSCPQKYRTYHWLYEIDGHTDGRSCQGGFVLKIPFVVCLDAKHRTSSSASLSGVRSLYQVFLAGQGLPYALVDVLLLQALSPFE